MLHQHPQPKLSNKATYGTAERLHGKNLQFGTSSCVSTRRSHIHINGLFVLRFLATAHRQECLRGKQRWLAGALRCCPSKGGTPPGISHWCQTGHQVQSSENDCRLQMATEQITLQIHSILHRCNHIIISRCYCQFTATA